MKLTGRSGKPVATFVHTDGQGKSPLPTSGSGDGGRAGDLPRHRRTPVGCPVGDTVVRGTGRVNGRATFAGPLLDSFQNSPHAQGVTTPSDLEQELRSAALRVTRPRLAVLGVVRAHPHATTDTVLRLVREQLPEVSHQAVYDVLRALTSSGLVRRIEPSGSVARYESRVGDNHHHLVCRSCGVIVDVDCAIGEAPCLTPSADRGFVVDEAEVIYWGRCAACVAAPASPHPVPQLPVPQLHA